MLPLQECLQRCESHTKSRATFLNLMMTFRSDRSEKYYEMKVHNQTGDTFFSMALSYIEVGRVAASADTSTKSIGNYENAVAYQLFHAIELFYKSMISNAGKSVKNTHDLSELENQYKACYPDPRYRFNNPFDFSSYEPEALNPNDMQLAQSHLAKFKPPYMSQHLRYPPDHRTGRYSFSFDESFFTGMKEKFQEIYETGI